MHVVIVGGGIVGTAVAARLGRTEHEVTLLERGSPGEETTAASAGIFTWGTPTPTALDHDLRERSWATYGALVDEGTIGATQVGLLYVAETAETASRFESAAETLRSFDLDASFVPPDGLEAFGLEPAAREPRGGLHTSDEPYVDTAELVSHFATVAADEGGDLRTRTALTDVLIEGGAVTGVGTDDGNLACDAVVNAAGPWAPTINAFAGVSLPLCHTRGPMVAFDLEAGRTTDELPVTVFEDGSYVRPAGRSRAWVGHYRTDYVEEQLYDPAAASVDDAFREAAAGLAADVPALDGAEMVGEWIGLRTVTPDGRPLVGETTLDGYHVAAGMSGQGITLAPAAADVIAETLGGVVDEDVRAALSPGRF